MKRFATILLAGMAASGALQAQTVTRDGDMNQVTVDMTPLELNTGGRVMTGAFAKTTAQGEVDGAAYIHQWPGVYFAAAFTGGDVVLRFNDSYNHYGLLVDGKAVTRIDKPGAAEYRVSGLSDGPHTVRLEKGSESQSDTGEFDGFFIPATQTALPAPHLTRQIEFIGDSYTVGYGNTSTSRQCTPEQLRATTDTQQAFGPLVAKHFNADYQVNAISGRGIVRNYDGFIADPLPGVYPFTLFDGGQVYGAYDWQPQIIVVALGGNDFSTPVHAGDKWKTLEALRADYIDNYVALVKRIYETDPNVEFVLMSYGEDEVSNDIAVVTSRLKADGIDRLGFFNAALDYAKTGCDWHLNTDDDKKISDALVTWIDQQPDIWNGQ